MAPVLRQQLAFLEPDIAFLGKALDGEDIAVIDPRAFGLALDLRLAVFGDADAVAFGRWRSRACGIPRNALLVQRQRGLVPSLRMTVTASRLRSTTTASPFANRPRSRAFRLFACA